MPQGQATTVLCNVASAGSSLNSRALTSARRGKQSRAEQGLKKPHLPSTERRHSLILSREPVFTDRGWGLGTQVYYKECHLLGALCHLLLRTEIQQSPSYLQIILSVYTWLPQTRVKPVPEGPCFGTQSSPGVSLLRPSSLAFFQNTYIQFLHGLTQVYQQQSKGPFQETACHPCRGRLGNTTGGHVLSKRGAKNPEDVLGAFLGKLTYAG